MTNTEIALKSVTQVFIKRDLAALDQFFSPNYIQHNPALPNGTHMLRELIAKLPPDFKYETGLTASYQDIVMKHGRFSNWFGKTYIAVDIFRIEDGKLAEHWDVLQEEIGTENSVNGNPMFSIV